jgi:uncharacterized Zn finger protein
MRLLSEDEYLDAVQDAAHDHFLEVAVKCADCGTLYDRGHHPATRCEPAWIERDECPNCGSAEIKQSTGTGEGRIG